MAAKVSFKVYLQDPSVEEGAEVRRFLVDKAVSTSLILIREKLVTVFPILADHDFSISWKDAEGDNITVDSDNELILAMTELAGPVYKLTATVGGTRKSQQQEEEVAAGASTTHAGVMCDSCDMAPIAGFRYKCVVCQDYDLCGTCNTAGRHPGHNMMRISGPEVIWPQRLFQRIHKMQEKAKQKSRNGQENKGNGAGKAPGAGGAAPWLQLFDFKFHQGSVGMGCGMFGCCRKGGIGREGRGGSGWGGGWGGMDPRGGAQCGSWAFPEGACGTWAGPAFKAMMKAWTGEDQTGQQAPKGREHSARDQEAQATAAAAHQFAQSAVQATAQGIHTAAHVAGQAAKVAEEALAKAGMSPVRSGQEYLQKVVGDTLDPLGKYMVDAETPGGHQTTVSRSSSVTIAEDRETQEKEENSASPDDDDGWTVLTDENPEVGGDVEIPLLEPTVYPSLLTSKKPTKTSTTVEPSAPMTTNAPTTIDPSGPSATAQRVQSKPRTQVALQAMINMGFSNEGNWLANLIEAKDGDISKVLDILQVVKK